MRKRSSASIIGNSAFSPETIPYSNEALRSDLARLEGAWEAVQSSRERKAVYRYLTAVFELVAWWKADGEEFVRARRALRSRGLEPLPREQPHASIIRCTADPAKVDKRTRSKWCRVMLCAELEKLTSETFEQFVGRKGGLNECAMRFRGWMARPNRQDLWSDE